LKFQNVNARSSQGKSIFLQTTKIFFNPNFKLKSELNIFFYYNSQIFCISRVNATLRYQNNEILNLSNKPCFFSCRYGKPKPMKNFLKCKKQLIEGNNAFPPSKSGCRPHIATHTHLQAHAHIHTHTHFLFYFVSPERWKKQTNNGWVCVCAFWRVNFKMLK
jgi:hypothetical protein